MKIRVFCLWVALWLHGTLLPASSSQAQGTWSSLPAGTIIYAEVITPPDAIYQGRDLASATALSNERYYPDNFRVSALYRYLNPAAIIRVKVMVGGTWGEILPDNYYSPYRENPYDTVLTYVALQFLRPLDPAELTPLTVFPDTQAVDRLIIAILDQGSPRLVVMEGTRIVMHIPIMVGGEVIGGDFRIHTSRLSGHVPIQRDIEVEPPEATPPPDELPLRTPDIAGVPYMLTYGDGLNIHSAAWWNWAEIANGLPLPRMTGIQLPDAEWFTAQVGDDAISLDRWLYRWVSANLDYDESDPTVEEAHSGGDAAWYQGVSSVRVIAVNTLDELYHYPTPQQLGGPAASAQISDWATVIRAVQTIGDNWLIPSPSPLGGEGLGVGTMIPVGLTPAAQNGTSVAEKWVLLNCDAATDQPAYAGSTRTESAVCDHLIRERQGSICTPERVEMDFLGQRVLCNRRKFERLPLRTLGELIEHESIHLAQFSGVFYDLALQGVSPDDPSPNVVDSRQLSSIGVTELMAQTVNAGSDYAADYWFVIVGSDGRAVDNWATADQVWRHLHRECGDPTGDDPTTQALLVAGLMGDRTAYADLTSRCSLPPHRLVPDRSR